MNREVEERLVAMYFDNRDFEKNAQQTIETLDQLKKSMNLEDSVKGFDMFDRMKRNAGMEQMQRSANKLKETFGSVGTTLNKAFQIGTGPLRQFENTLGTMRSYISRYLGFDFASKVVNSVESAVRGLTLQPISQGWGQYEAEVDSVRTIMSSTGRSIDDVTKNLDDLRAYADKTIYSLTDMTSNLGKFTNNGVELEKATQAMMGVANAAALAGQGTQQASMAMYNISQAIGVGKMTSIDWKSIENANMATKDLKQTFIEVAAAQDNLKKVEKDGVTTYYYVKDSNGREIKDQKKWVEVNYKNFRETLSKGWLTSDTLTTTLAALSGQSIGIDEWAAMGIEDKELIKHLEEMGQKALEAASQVRTFSKMMTTLKDSVASGWSQSFRFVFGNADEATEFWTSISERIGGVLNESANARNKVLKKWKETREVLGTGLNRESISGDHEQGGLVEYTIYGRNGREILIDGLKNLMDVFGELGKAVSRAFGDVFGSIGGEDLFAKTQAFEKLTIRLKEWLGTLDDSGSKLNKIYRIVRGVISGFKLWKNTLRNAADTIIKLLIPGADGVLDILANLGDFLYDLANLKPEEIIKKIGEKLKEAWEKIKSWFTPRKLFDNFGNAIGTEVPIVKWLNSLWENLTSTGNKILSELGLGGFVSWLLTVKDGLVAAWESITGWEGWKSVGDFFGNVWSWLEEKFTNVANWFTVANYGEGEDKTGFALWLENVTNTFQTAYNGITGWTGWTQIGDFFSNIWTFLSTKFTDIAKWFTVVNYGEGEDKTGFALWLDNVTNTFQTAYNGITGWSGWTQIGNFFSNIWTFLSTKFTDIAKWFTVVNYGEGEDKTGFALWLENVTTTFQKAYDGITGWTGWTQISTFFSDVWAWITTHLEGVAGWFTIAKYGEEGDKTGFALWLENVAGTFETAYNSVINWDGWKKVNSFFSNVWEFLKAKFGGIAKWFTDPKEGEKTGFVLFLEGVKQKLETAWSDITGWEGWAAIGSFLSDTFAFIAGLISSGSTEEEAVSSDGKESESVKKTREAIEEQAEQIDNLTDTGGLLRQKLDAIGGFFERLFSGIGKIFTDIVDYFKEHGIFSNETITEFFRSVGTFLDGALTAISDLLKNLGGWMRGDLTFAQFLAQTDAVTKLFELALVPMVTNLIGFGQGLLAKGLGIHMASIGAEIAALGTGLALITGSIVALYVSGISDAEITRLAGWLVGFSVVFGAIFTIIEFFVGKFNQGAGDVSGSKFDGTKVVTKIISAFEIIGLVYVVLEKLPEVIKTMATYRSSFGEGSMAIEVIGTIVGVLGGILVAAAAFVGVAALADALKGGAAALGKGALAVVAVLAVMAGIIALVGNTIQDVEWGKELPEKMKAVRDSIGEFVGIFTDIVKDVATVPSEVVRDSLSNVGEGIGDLGEGFINATGSLTEEQRMQMTSDAQVRLFNDAVNNLIKISEALSPEKLTAIAQITDKISQLQGYSYKDFNEAFGGGAANFEGFVRGVRVLVDSLSEILKELSGDDTMYSEFMKSADLQAEFDHYLELIKKILGLLGYFSDSVQDLFKDRNSPMYAFTMMNRLATEGPYATSGTTWFKQFLNNISTMYQQIGEVIADKSSGYGDIVGKEAEMDKTFASIIHIVGLLSKVMEFASITGEVEKVLEPFIKDKGEYKVSKGADFTTRNVAIIDSVLGSISTMYSHVKNYMDRSQFFTEEDVDKYIQMMTNAVNFMNVFGEHGIGSDTWQRNYTAFSEMLKDDSFVTTYISNLEAIYERLKDSKLGTDEAITFNGTNIVSNLFTAVQEGLNSDNIPSLDAHVITDKIIASIGLGKTAMAQAVRDMIQAGVDQVTVPTTNSDGGLDYSDLLNVDPKLLEMLTDPTGYAQKLISDNGILDTITGTFSSKLGEFFNNDSPIMTMFSGFQEQLEKSIPDLNLTAILSEKGYMMVDDEGNPTGILADITSAIESVSQSLDNKPIFIKIQPIFDLTKLTPEELQKQLDSHSFSMKVRSIEMPETSIDFTGLRTELGMDEIKQKLDAIKLAIDLYGSGNISATSNLGIHMDGIRNEIFGMNLVLDTGVLVGQMLPLIDVGLYNRALTQYRTGTAPRNGAVYVP